MKLIISTIITIGLLMFISYGIGVNSRSAIFSSKELIDSVIIRSDSLCVLNKTLNDSFANHLKKDKFKDSVNKEIIKMAYTDGYIQGALQYKIFIETIDTISKYDIDSLNLDL